jgi:predicted ATPase
VVIRTPDRRLRLFVSPHRLLDPDELLGRLAGSLDALGTGAVDLPPRQRTLRATVEWSVGLLEDPARPLLETVAVFVDGWTVEAAAQVAGLDGDRVLEGTETLAGHSLIRVDVTDDDPRCRMLDTVRAFVAERLRRRSALGVWPLLRRGEAALVTQVRLALGADRFDKVFAAGARLSQREAVAAVRDRPAAATAGR